MLKNIFNYGFLYSLFITVSLVVISPSVVAAKKQHVFLDDNGVPISMEVLQFLSSGGSPSKRAVSKTSSKNLTSKKKLPPKKKPRVSTPEKERELLDALLIGNIAKAKYLIKSGVKANYRNDKGETPLSVAVDKAWASMVVTLVEHGANIEQRMPTGVSLLHHASSRGHTDVAKMLIKHGLNPAARSKNKKWNSLHVAARYGRWQLVQLYVQMGIDPNARTSDGKTALEIAKIVRHPGIIKILSAVTSARPVGWSTRYIKRNNRLHYQEIEERKRSRLQEKRKVARSKMR